MVDLHRWLKRTSPHLVIVGSLMIAGLSGCRSTRPTPVALESASPAYSTPHAVPTGSPPPLTIPSVRANGDLNTDQLTAENELFLDPPEPPPVNTSVRKGLDNGYDEEVLDSLPAVAEVPPAAPLPEPFPLEEFSGATEVADSASEVIDVESPEGNGSDVVSSDPLNAANLFPEDNPETDSDTVSSSEALADLPFDSKDVASDTDSTDPELLPDSLENPFANTLGPSISNPEVPIPDPSQPGKTISLPEVEPASPQSRATDETLTAPATSALFPASSADNAGSESQASISQEKAVDLFASSSIQRLPEPQLPESRAKESKQKVEFRSLNTQQADASVVAETWMTGDNVVFDRAGNAFVSNGNHISKVYPDGSVEPWATLGAPRGHAILPDGSHLVCDAGQRAIVKLNSEGEQTRALATKSNGRFLRAPNDLVVDSNGGIYFTDPGYARLQNPIGRIHYVAPDGNVTIVAQKLSFPEGIALSSDGSKLLVVESLAQNVVEFEILSPGQVGPKRTFAKLTERTDEQTTGFANGLTVDGKSGRVFVAHGEKQRIEVLSPDGELLKSLQLDVVVNDVTLREDTPGRVFAAGGTQSGENTGQLLEVRIID